MNLHICSSSAWRNKLVEVGFGQSSTFFFARHQLETWTLFVEGPVVRRPIGISPGLNFNPGVFFCLSLALSRIISSMLFRVVYHQIVDEKN